MLKTIFGYAGIALLTATSLQSGSLQQSPGASGPPADQYRAILDKYCVTCHNERLKTAGLMLDKMDVANVFAGAETWEKVIQKLRGGAMPPPGAPRPDKATYDSLATYLETAIDRETFARPNPGRP